MAEPAVLTLNPEASHFRLRRLEPDTGMWRNFWVQTQSGVVDRFPVSDWTDDLPTRLPVGTWRVVWMKVDPKGRLRPIGNSAILRVSPPDPTSAAQDGQRGGGVTPPASGHPQPEVGGGAPPGVPPTGQVAPANVLINGSSATVGSTFRAACPPGPDPALSGSGQTLPQAATLARPVSYDTGPAMAVREPGRLETGEVLGFLRGLAWVVQSVTEPIVRGVQDDAALRMARDRSYFDAQIQQQKQDAIAALERDRQFSAAIQAAYARPGESAIDAMRAEFRAELASLRGLLDAPSDPEDDEGDKKKETDETKAGDNPWTLAGKALENAPEIIRTIASVARENGSSPVETVAKAVEG